MQLLLINVKIFITPYIEVNFVCNTPLELSLFIFILNCCCCFFNLILFPGCLFTFVFFNLETVYICVVVVCVLLRFIFTQAFKFRLNLSLSRSLLERIFQIILFKDRLRIKHVPLCAPFLL